MTKDELLNKLFSQYKIQGFLLKDDILSEILNDDTFIADVERICNELYIRNVFICDEPELCFK